MVKKTKSKNKKTEKNSGKKPVKKNRDHNEKQLIFVLITILIVFGAFLGTYFFVQSLKTFEYGGVNFKKITYETLELYHGRFPIIYKDVLKSEYNFYLRTDPRKNNIPVDTEILFNPEIIISLEPDAGNCLGASLGQIEISKFLSAFGRFKITSAVTNQESAKELNVSYATCDNADKHSSVIIIQKSETPSIEQGDNENCYYVNVGECENTKTIERFIIGVIAQINEADISY